MGLGGLRAAAIDLYAAMRCAPATRDFTDRPVPRGLLTHALEQARFAPSGGNRQGWRVIVVTDPAGRRRLRELYQPLWASYRAKAGLDEPPSVGAVEPISPGRRRGIEGAERYARTFDRAPVHLVVCVDVAALAIVDRDLDRPSIVGGASIYPFVQNLLLALRAEGLGAAFTTMLVAAEQEVRELLEIPEPFILAGHISVGFRADPWPARLRREPVERFAFAERFGEQWLEPDECDR